MLQRQQHFLFVQRKVVFTREDAIACIDFEFIPITFGDFYGFVLFCSERLGQFIDRIVRHSAFPPPQSWNVNVKIGVGQHSAELVNSDPRISFCSR
jgi:hypothetical protein